MLSKEQEKNYSFFQKRLPELLSDPLKNEKYVVIYDSTIEGIFDTFDTAYRAACIKFDRDFIVQQIIDESRIVNFLSTAVSI